MVVFNISIDIKKKVLVLSGAVIAESRFPVCLTRLKLISFTTISLLLERLMKDLYVNTLLLLGLLPLYIYFCHSFKLSVR